MLLTYNNFTSVSALDRWMRLVSALDRWMRLTKAFRFNGYVEYILDRDADKFVTDGL